MEIRKAAVIGAGVMGAGIAAHLTNAGLPVVLLDIAAEGEQRNAVADGAVERLLKSEPAAFMHKRNARLISTGNIEDHLDRLSDCDWIVEAVVEHLDRKRELYGRILPYLRPDAVLSSNTSSIPLAALVADMPSAFSRRFLITHFFNPPRYMRLLELVAGEHTNQKAVSGIREFAERALGKGVVECRDTPGFIANRIGIYWMQTAIQEAISGGLTVEQADAVFGRPMGIPKTGVFGLADLVGLELFPYLMTSMASALPVGDPLLEKMEIPPLIESMIEQGYNGCKAERGFYRRGEQAGREAIDLSSGEYRPLRKAKLGSLQAAREGGVVALMEHGDIGATYAWRVFSQLICYAAGLIPEIADDVLSVDQAMKWGYGWKYGPFELADQLGCGFLVDRLEREGTAVPALLKTAAEKGFYTGLKPGLGYLDRDRGYRRLRRPEGVLLLEDVKRDRKPLKRNSSASLWDLGEDVVCLEFHSKMNTLDPDILAMIETAVVALVPREYRALVLYNEAGNYSAGANLGLLLGAAKQRRWSEIEGLLIEGQRVFSAMKYAPFPVVGAPMGLSLGGGCETLLHCDALQAHAETYMGLVEAGVGLIPAWGGCKELLMRWLANSRRPGGPMPAISQCFEMISTAAVAKSAAEAQARMLLRPEDGITMNRDMLLWDAKARALRMSANYSPPKPVEVHLPGPSARLALGLAVDSFRHSGRATPHDQVVAMALAGVLSGGTADIADFVTESDLLHLERTAFMELIKHPDTLARLEHMLQTGKPLRN